MKYAAPVLAMAVVGIVLFPVLAGNDFPSISHEALTKAIKEKKVVLIDCNGSESYKNGHIPGALDMASAGKDLASKLPADKGALIVAYCGSEQCNAYQAGAKAAQKLGYTNVQHYAGGISGWKAKGETMEKAETAK